MVRVLLSFCLLVLLISCGEDKTVNYQLSTVNYLSPVDYEITLAGNFGEPRPWHFHGGLDIKTNNEEGKPIFSIAEGYVSRLTVGMYGFGNAIYVCHPDGHTSVYCHLQRFAPEYEALLQRKGHDTLSMVLPPRQFPVKAGQLIAISGNTGHSTGPHLHLEIHDTETWVMRDPMQFLGHLIADTVAPQAHSLMAVPMPGEGVFCGSPDKQTFPINQPSTKVQRSTFIVQRSTFTAWGRVGFALWADDYSEATYHHYGIRRMQLLVDGREVFRSDVDSIPISCQPEVNLWGDYDYWRHHRRWYMKAYREPRMRLPILHTDLHRGIVNFNEERPYRLTFVLSDYQNNRATYHLTVLGQRDTTVSVAAGARAVSGQPRQPALLDDYRLFRQCLWPLMTTKR